MMFVKNNLYVNRYSGNCTHDQHKAVGWYRLGFEVDIYHLVDGEWVWATAWVF